MTFLGPGSSQSGLLLWVYILLSVGSGLSSCIIPRTHRQALSFGALDPWTLGWHAIFFSGLAQPQGAPMTTSCLGPYEGAVCELL